MPAQHVCRQSRCAIALGGGRQGENAVGGQWYRRSSELAAPPLLQALPSASCALAGPFPRAATTQRCPPTRKPAARSVGRICALLAPPATLGQLIAPARCAQHAAAAPRLACSLVQRRAHHARLAQSAARWPGGMPAHAPSPAAISTAITMATAPALPPSPTPCARRVR